MRYLRNLKVGINDYRRIRRKFHKGGQVATNDINDLYLHTTLRFERQ